MTRFLKLFQIIWSPLGITANAISDLLEIYNLHRDGTGGKTSDSPWHHSPRKLASGASDSPLFPPECIFCDSGGTGVCILGGQWREAIISAGGTNLYIQLQWITVTTCRAVAVGLHFSIYLLYVTNGRKCNCQAVIILASRYGALPQICSKWQASLWIWGHRGPGFLLAGGRGPLAPFRTTPVLCKTRDQRYDRKTERPVAFLSWKKWKMHGRK